MLNLTDEARRETLAKLPTPDDVRRELSRRRRECNVLLRLLRLAEYARSVLVDHPADRQRESGVQR